MIDAKSGLVYYGQRYKLKNRRVTVYRFSDNSWGIQYKRLGGKGEPRVVVTRFTLSDEAAQATMKIIRYLNSESVTRILEAEQAAATFAESVSLAVSNDGGEQ